MERKNFKKHFTSPPDRAIVHEIREGRQTLMDSEALSMTHSVPVASYFYFFSFTYDKVKLIGVS